MKLFVQVRRPGSLWRHYVFAERDSWRRAFAEVVSPERLDRKAVLRLGRKLSRLLEHSGSAADLSDYVAVLSAFYECGLYWSSVYCSGADSSGRSLWFEISRDWLYFDLKVPGSEWPIVKLTARYFRLPPLSTGMRVISDVIDLIQLIADGSEGR
ncbi:MAG: hypothetical protein QXX12_00390 [Nanopusillaceae archaeon]